MNRLDVCCLMIGVAACGSGEGYAPCEDVHDVSLDGPGAPVPGDPVRAYGLRSHGRSITAMTDGSVIVPTCGGLTTIGASQPRQLAIESTQWVAIAPDDDTIYATTLGDVPAAVALSPTGVLRWRTPLDAANLVAGADGAYAQVGGALVRLDPVTGARQDLPSSPGLVLLGAAPGDGALAALAGSDQSVIRHVDATGVRWEATATGRSINVRGAAAMPDGSVVVLGNALGQVEIAGMSIALAGSSLSFIAGLDDQGVARWGYAVDLYPSRSSGRVAVMPSGDIVLGGQAGGSFDDAELIIARPDGVVRSQTYVGPGYQEILGTAAAADGRLWLLLDSSLDIDTTVARFKIGTHVFDEPQSYLFELSL